MTSPPARPTSTPPSAPRPSLDPRRPRRLGQPRAVGAAIVALVLVAAACGTGGGSSSSAPLASTGSGSAPTTGGGPGGGGPAAGALLCATADQVAALPLRSRLAQLLMVGLEPAQLTAGAGGELARSPGVGGIFVARGDAAALAPLALDELRTPEGIDLLVSADQEGGGVQKISGTPVMPWPRQQAAQTPAEVQAMAGAQGQALRAAGIDMNLAPVVDVSSQPTEKPIGRRSYGADPAVVTTHAGAFAVGMRDAAVLPVLKHFPGHGRAEGDSHTGTATAPPLADLQAVDLVPYRPLIAAGPVAVMLGHLDVPGLTAPDEPATLSPAVMRLLRQDVGFDGMVMSDDLSGMKAISARLGLAEAVRRFLAAGGDLALWQATGTGQADDVVDHLEAAVASGTLDEASVNRSVVRVLTAKRFPAGVTC